MWTAVVKDFGFLLDEYDRDHDGPEDDARVAIESVDRFRIRDRDDA